MTNFMEFRLFTSSPKLNCPQDGKKMLGQSSRHGGIAHFAGGPPAMAGHLQHPVWFRLVRVRELESPNIPLMDGERKSIRGGKSPGVALIRRPSIRAFRGNLEKNGRKTMKLERKVEWFENFFLSWPYYPASPSPLWASFSGMSSKAL